MFAVFDLVLTSNPEAFGKVLERITLTGDPHLLPATEGVIHLHPACRLADTGSRRVQEIYVMEGDWLRYTLDGNDAVIQELGGDPFTDRYQLDSSFPPPGDTDDKMGGVPLRQSVTRLGTLIQVEVEDLGGERIKVHPQLLFPRPLSVLVYFSSVLLQGIVQRWSEAGPQLGLGQPEERKRARATKRGPGAPGLSRNDRVNRLALADWGREIYEVGKTNKMVMTWQQVAVAIKWPFGSDEAGVKLLQYARADLRRLREDGDPTGLLRDMKRWREKNRIG